MFEYYKRFVSLFAYEDTNVTPQPIREQRVFLQCDDELAVLTFVSVSVSQASLRAR